MRRILLRFMFFFCLDTKDAPYLLFIGRLDEGEREVALMGPMGPNEPRRTTKGPKWENKKRAS